MNKLSTLANLAEILGVLIVIGGLFFAVLQMRQIRQQRRELAAIELFRFFGNANFARAYNRILHLPDGLSAEEIANGENDLASAAVVIGNTLENIGVMTFQRIVPFRIVRNLIGASAILLWRKLECWALALREEVDDPAAFEWFQWLAERLDELQDSDEPPAYIAEKGWLPSNTKQHF